MIRKIARLVYHILTNLGAFCHARIALAQPIGLWCVQYFRIFEHLAISFKFPSAFKNFLNFSFKIFSPLIFLHFFKISFQKEISFKMEALLGRLGIIKGQGQASVLVFSIMG